jgi:hypothetical protein
MSNRKPVAPFPTLLTAAIAGLASGQALAETAGHVSFVAGTVNAISPDGHSRALRKGDDINGGDRISTGAGRLQVRFSDGGFVALQPNTVFSVDQYVYANKKPEESSLFFNLVRGGMRTITGVIGHINKASYRVKTPVATIGIRGTEYLAEYDGDSLHVSVGLGSVFVANDQGNITLVTGQSAKVLPNAAPFQTSEQGDVGAPGPGASGGGSGNAPGDATAGNQVNGDGGILLANGTPLASSDQPVFTVATTSSAFAASQGAAAIPFNGGAAYADVAATFDPIIGGLQSVSFGSPATTGFDRGTLQYNGVTNVDGVISLGEVTNGTDGTGQLTVANGSYVPYVVGLTGPAPGATGTAHYSLLAATTPRFNGAGSGQLKQFDLDIDLAQQLLGLNMILHINGDTGDYQVSGSGLTPTFSGSAFQLTGGYSISGPGCTDGCSAAFNGFYAGSNGNYLGTVYDLRTTVGDDITGGAALGLVGIGVPSMPVSSTPLVTGSGYTFAAPIGTSGGALSIYGNLGATFDFAGALTAASDSNNNTIFANSSLHYNELTTLGTLSYAELTDGTGTVYTGSSATTQQDNLTLSSQIYLPYMVGVAQAAPQADQIAHFSAVGGSSPRLNASEAGVLNHLNLDINLGLGLINADLQVTLSGNNVFTATGTGMTGLNADGTFGLNSLPVTGSVCDGSNCHAAIAGFLSPGDQSTGAEAGAVYQIVLPSGYGVVVGTAVLEQSSVALGNTGLVVAAPGNGNTGYFAGISEIQSATDGLLAASYASANGVTTVASRPDTSSVTSDDKGSVGSDTLEWGRWVSGSATVNGAATSLSTTDALHYITGHMTPTADLQSLASSNATATYALIGSTHPTDGTHSGDLTSGSLAVDFGKSTMQVDLQVAIASLNYHVNDTQAFTSGQPGFNLSQLATTGTGAGACSSGCSTNINGFFAGAQASNIGLGYAISDPLQKTVQGAAAFQKQ